MDEKLLEETPWSLAHPSTAILKTTTVFESYDLLTEFLEGRRRSKIDNLAILEEGPEVLELLDFGRRLSC